MCCSRRETKMIRVKMSLSLSLPSSVSRSYDTFHGIKQSTQTQFLTLIISTVLEIVMWLNTLEDGVS